MFSCALCGRSDLATGRAWKAHMNRAHGKWTRKQWLEAAQNASALTTKPGDTTEPPPESEAALPGAGPVSTAATQLTERFTAMKGKIAKSLGVLSFRPLETLLKFEPLTEDDRKTLAEGWQATLDMIDLQPAFQTRTLELKSFLWVFLFPILALALVVAERIDYRALWEFVEAKPKDKSNRGDHRPEGRGENHPGGPDSPSA